MGKSLKVCCAFWKANQESKPFSRMYDESWVEKLYRGFARNLTVPFEFICFTDHNRRFMSENISQLPLIRRPFGYGSCVEPYRLGEPMIMVGLDTVVTGNCDALADYCLNADRLALPSDPYRPEKACNGVALVPEGFDTIYAAWTGQNDMDLICNWPHDRIDDLFPGKVLSYKGHVKKGGLGDAAICYFHGNDKPHEIEEDFVKEHWV